jgi:hypothetical protein
VERINFLNLASVCDEYRLLPQGKFINVLFLIYRTGGKKEYALFNL